MTDSNQKITKEEAIKMLQENPGLLLENLSSTSGLSVSELIECLPAGMWKKISGEQFIDVMQSLSNLEKVTVLVHTPDVILEYSGQLPTGKLGHGFYNLSPKSPLHGHLRASNCKDIYLVERPFMNTKTVSVQFMNGAGGAMFKVFAGRNEKGELIPEQVEAMRSIFESKQ